jgi:hypothetical protein
MPSISANTYETAVILICIDYLGFILGHWIKGEGQ